MKANSISYLRTKGAQAVIGVLCAYEKGFQDGLERKEQLDLSLDSLLESQAGTVRHRSPHAAYAIGYLDGVRESYERN